MVCKCYISDEARWKHEFSQPHWQRNDGDTREQSELKATKSKRETSRQNEP